jgi:hypothetical protein
MASAEEELERFRRQWKEEVTAKTKTKPQAALTPGRQGMCYIVLQDHGTHHLVTTMLKDSVFSKAQLRS